MQTAINPEAPLHPLAALSRGIEEFRVLREAMPAQLIVVFLAIAQRPGVHQRSLASLVGTSTASVSRNLSALSWHSRHGEPGLGLIDKVIDPLGDRSPQLFLTKAGEDLVRRLTATARPALKAEKAFAGAHWENWVD